ncbi:type ISP restriction/modification enzyme [Gramella sp. KN1008]|uniref:type ISP restriction/modification enzyme n=1 Tax=Gramella sp. KN1008 TaxID=2529298 RepID=UPI0010409AD5|nr:type ISP restriction/modification enzyme [Gramella sp. KN1008]TBW26988.1 DNA methyltransferase [Gramella sp. KN1008]
MTIAEYLSHLNRLYLTGHAREHSYRGDLQTLLSTLLPDILVTNEPARVSCGAPDYMLSRKGVPVGYVEAKDIGVDLDSKGLKEQFERYKSGLTNLIITDYLNFRFYREGEFITEISIGSVEDGEIKPLPGNFEHFTHLISDFALVVTQSIKSPTRLAKMMAGKARLMADVIEKSLNSDDEQEKRSNLKSQMISFQQMLIHDITNRSFADIYSQTIAYGMFAARYHDPTLPTFSRMEAAQLIPKSNPFLRKLFQDIAGFDLDDRLVWIVEELVSIFLASDVSKIMKNFGKSTKQDDPVVHFYETFLGEYNPALRKARGVWYTPQPVVNFIVRAVDDILKDEFNLPQGLADTSKTKITVKVPTHDKRYAGGMRDYEQEVHKVQILDPATGTGTFLAEVVRQIHKKFEGQQGIWTRYATEHLIPRLNGFELLMASYAMAHLKMDMLLTETGYKPADDQRFRIFLTNSLEEAHPDTGTLFSSWLSDEADQANAIKRDTPVMCVIGNPPYSGESANKGKWIMDLMEDYKKEPGGREKLKERNPKWINDDYVKFMRFGQYFIERNGEGILAFINPHGYLDNPTFRGMRWNLLKTYDKLYTIDLHGNSTKKETAPDGSVDQNVFDIMQGVSINIFLKTGVKENDELGQIYHYDLYGRRDNKYNFLLKNSLQSINFKALPNISPNFFFVKKDFNERKIYKSGFALKDLFPVNGMGITTAHDEFVIRENKTELINFFKDFKDSVRNASVLHQAFKVRTKKGWDILKGFDELQKSKDISEFVEPISYRPFDNRFIFYEDNLVWRTVRAIFQHMLQPNCAISLIRRSRSNNFITPIVIDKIADKSVSSTLDNSAVFPLYLYPETSDQQTTGHEQQIRTPNLDPAILSKIAKNLGLSFVSEKETGSNLCMANSEEVRDDFKTTFAPIDLLDYIYAVLHSPEYREKYKEFLKIDFPRVPYPEDSAKFWKLVDLGGQIRKLHLLESPLLEKRITGYPEDGDNIITRKITKTSPGYEPDSETHGKVWINEQQYFDNVPLVAWEFYIGGYQPAQKWLKDRKGRELSFEDILHYQKMIVALTETHRLMKEIDKVGILKEEITVEQ